MDEQSVRAIKLQERAIIDMLLQLRKAVIRLNTCDICLETLPVMLTAD